MNHFRLTCCDQSVSCGVPEGMAYADLPPLAFWLSQHHGHPMQVSTLRPEPLPKRAPRPRRESVAAQGRLVL